MFVIRSALPPSSAGSGAKEGYAAIQARGVSQAAGSDRGDLEAQRQAIAAACRRHGWQPLERLEQAGAGANERTRPGLAEARRTLAHPNANALVAAKQATLPKLLLDLAALLAAAQTQGWTLVALDSAPATPAAGPNPNLVAAFAPFERRLISERTRQALARKRAQGVRLGRPPTIAPHLIERIRRERAAGKTLAAIADALNNDHVPTAQGGQRWYPATIRHTLNRTN
jgi:DNA invertase Pin-like site-specific DNA recombinase